MVNAPKVYTAIGLMSGTSLDGVDAALLETDGYGHVKPLSFVSRAYDAKTRMAIRKVLGRQDRDHADVIEASELLTRRHADVVAALLQSAHMKPRQVDVIGFHGQTIYHAPDQGVTVQIGDAALLAAETGLNVVHDFRSADVRAGGQGAPFLPLYHQARVQAGGLKLPAAILNIGGVANVTWIGGTSAEEILAFDTGPGNALMDDFIKKRTGRDYDDDGALARIGMVDKAVLEQFLASPYFEEAIPKSLDRDHWSADLVHGLSDADGLATLAECTARAAAKALQVMPLAPETWYVTGGGRKNSHLMDRLRHILRTPVESVDDLGWNGDAIEAEGFAYLAVRSLLGEPLSVPGTTGVPEPQTGGVLVRASDTLKIAAN